MNTYDHTCPDCGGGMVLHVNGQTREKFYGCLLYPACMGTRALEGEQ